MILDIIIYVLIGLLICFALAIIIYLLKTDHKEIKESQSAKPISKKEQAFDIINEKRVNVLLLKDSFFYKNGLEYYNREICWKYLKLTKEEYALLKEVLDNE